MTERTIYEHPNFDQHFQILVRINLYPIEKGDSL
jgi:hypothetical protein